MRDKPTQANRALGVISKMMNLAEAWGLHPDRSNPCYHVRKFKETRRERFLTTDELARLGKALDEEESFAPAAVTEFRLLLYTGARLYAMLKRNLLYAEVTRGKRLVVLVNQMKAAAIAVRNASGRRRWSRLDQWLAGATDGAEAAVDGWASCR